MRNLNTCFFFFFFLQYRDEMRLAGVEKTKHVYMAFINAYAKFGNFELAKQVKFVPFCTHYAVSSFCNCLQFKVYLISGINQCPYFLQLVYMAEHKYGETNGKLV